MAVIDRLLGEDFHYWDTLTQNYEDESKNLRVPSENSIDTLHDFNIRLNDLHTRAVYDYSRARRNKEAMERLMESVLKDYYQGSNEIARKAGGIQYARAFPAPDFWHEETVNLFDIQDKFSGYFYSMESTVKACLEKTNSKITNNALLNLESKLV